jgi:acetyl esterase/lipase
MTIETKDFIYKKVDNAELVIRFFFPQDLDPQEKRPAVIFFFGGGWEHGTIDRFAPQSRYAASHGFIAATPEYRIRSKHQTTPFESVEDAKDALDWVRRHSDELNIDAERIAVGGGSAGGHLAACTAMLKDRNYDRNEVFRIPKALVLFNPVCDTSENGYGHDRLGERKLELSPYHHITPGLPPSIIFHGTADKVVPYSNAVNFCTKMQLAGNDCTLITYEGRGHAFFSVEGIIDHQDTLDRMFHFLKRVL